MSKSYLSDLNARASELMGGGRAEEVPDHPAKQQQEPETSNTIYKDRLKADLKRLLEKAKKKSGVEQAEEVKTTFNSSLN
jgi:hypothetical protein